MLKQIKEFPAYWINERGSVWSTKSHKYLKPGDNSNGYLMVVLSNEKCTRPVTVASLVAKTFIGPRLKNKQINHKNGIKTDNRLENLEYVTGKQNMRHAVLNRLRGDARGSKNGHAKLTEEDVLKLRGELRHLSLKEASLLFGIGTKYVSDIRNRKFWKHI